jgi:ubiquinone/menaquinone biosynthesis C-methylase UbiE
MADINLTNFRSYNSRRRAKIWASFDRLQSCEKAVFSNITDKIRDKKILDIGVGAGRTTPFLLDLSRNYTAIDYSPAMIRVFTKKFPDIEIRHCDARNMGDFIEGSFDFIFFSFNGIDYVVHNDRLLILKEIYRILKQNGYFLFSSHNRDIRSFNNYSLKLRLSFPYLTPKKILSFCLAKLNHSKNKNMEIYTDEYAIINDPGHTYSLMTYFISVNQQIQQLKNIGFSSIKAFNKYGEEFFSDFESDWIHYLARK